MMWLVLLFVLVAEPVRSATYYVQSSPGTAATNCTEAQDIDTPHDTIAEGVACLSAGDTLYLRAGTYTQSINLMSPTVKTGTAGNPITIAGYPGESVIIRYTESTVNGIGGIRARGNIRYIVWDNLKIDGVNYANGVGWQIRDGNSDFTIRNVEIYNQFYNGLYLDNANNILIEDSYIHDARTDCVKVTATGSRWQGVYAHHGSNLVIRRSKFYRMPAQGVRVDPGPWNGVVIQDNQILNGNFCETNNNAALVIGTVGTGGTVQNVEVSGNIIAHNGYPYLTFPGGYGGGMKVIRLTNAITNLKINNNLIYDNIAPADAASGDSSNRGWGLQFISGVPTSTEVKNNIIMNNQEGALRNVNLTGVTVSHNGCTDVLFCGTTSKVTLTSIGQCLVDAANDDFRLVQGTNSCRGVGASVTTRPAPVGVTDIGPYEQGAIVSAVVSGSHIEATVNAMSGIRPGAGLTGLTLTCVTCTGTPTLLANVKAGSTNTIQISVSGLTGSGTARLNLGSTNITDSNFVGPNTGAGGGTAQFLNSLSALDITGTVDNTSGDPTPPAGGLYSEFLLADGSGETAADTSGNANHGTVSTGVTWVNDSSGTGVYIPTAEEAGDSTYRAITSTYGAGVNPTSESFSACILVLPDTQYSQKIPLSTGDYSSNRRAYLGWATVNGVKQWGLGVQGSTFSSGATEFPLQPTLTLACMRFNAATDTANLSINRTIGTSAAANKTYTSFTTSGNIRAGSDETFTTNTGGVTIYGMWVWNNTYISDADVQALYDSIFPEGGSVTCYKQQDFQAQRVYLDGSSDPINYGSAGAASIEVIAGGAVALVMQVDCTGSAGAPLAMQWIYAKNGGAYEHGIPLQFAADGIAMWGSDTDPSLNRFTVADCVSGALTENYGPTQLVAGATPTIELAQDHSYCIRAIVKFQSDQAGNYFQIRLYQDNSAVLDGGYTATPRIDVIPVQASGGF